MSHLIRTIVDVGSNSVLVLVAEQRSGQWYPLFESSTVTGLGVGTKASGLLLPDRMEATLIALKEAKRVSDSLGSCTFEAYGTMAVRIATNTPEFLALAAAQGTPVQVLTGEEEAELGFLSVASDPLFEGPQSLALIDPGGHSTELVVAEGSQRVFGHSFPVGALGLRELALPMETPGPGPLMRATQLIDEVLEANAPGEVKGVTVTVGATGTNLVSIRDGLLTWQPERVHGQTLTYEEISRAVAWLSSMTDAERAAVPGIERGREQTIHIGALILERFLYAIRAESVRVSVRGWRYGVLERPPRGTA